MVDKQAAETLVKVLGICYVVFAAFGLLMAFFVLGMAGLVGTSTAMMPEWTEFPREFGFAAGAMAAVFVVMALLTAAVAVFTLAVGVGLLRLRPWSRVGGIVAGVLALLSFPVGTLVGVLAIWLLGFEKNAIDLFARQPSFTSSDAPFLPGA